MDYKELYGLQESYNAMFSEQVTSTTHDWKRGTTKPPKAPTLPPPSGKETNSLPSRTPENAKNVRYYKDDVDLFDIVKGHLMSEGYADTEEAALAIMANMSEEWRQSIVESMASANRMKEIKQNGFGRPARSREFENRLPAERGSRGREFEHGSTRSASTPSGNLSANRGGGKGRERSHGPANIADKSPRDPKTGKLMY